MSIVTIALVLFIFISIIIYAVSTKKFDYWKKKGVPHLKPWPVLGNYGQYILLQKYIGQVAQKLCQRFPNEPYFGTYFGTEPALMVLDPDLLKLVLAKDFYYFNSRDNSNHNYKEKILNNIFFLNGDKWKLIRQNLTPLFSSSKLKNMFYLIEKCAHAMEQTLDIEAAASNVLEARPLMIRYTIDCICSCVFGVESNTLVPHSTNNPFTRIGNLVFTSSRYSAIKWISRSIWPGTFYRLGLKCFPELLLEFFSKMLFSVLEEREYKSTSRNDFVDLMLNLKQKTYIVGDSLSPKREDTKKVQLQVDDEFLVAQCSLFFSAGFETSASTLAHCLYEFAKNPEAQTKAQEEVDEYLRCHHNKLKYECISELPYVDACVHETMRLYPVLGVLTREVVDNYIFPTGLMVEKGLRIHIPVYHIHHNPDVYPEPEEFHPERFLPEARAQVLPFTYFPFGEGSRICIGKQFAKMQVISGLIAVLKKYSVALADGTPSKLEFEATTILTQPTCNLALKFTPRNGWDKRIFTK